MQKITLTHQDDTDLISMEINSEDMFLSDVISRLRSFLLAMSYSEESVDKFILNPNAEYSLLSFEEQYKMKLKIDLSEVESEELMCEEGCCKCCENDDELEFSTLEELELQIRKEDFLNMSADELRNICMEHDDCTNCIICDTFKDDCANCPKSGK